MSIIIPTLNNIENLKKCVASIQSQTFTDFEVCIIDGNSSDGTQDYLKTLKTPFHFISELDNGIYYAMNKGIKMSKGKWLFFLGADDYFYNDQVLFCVHQFLSDDIEVVSGKIKYRFTKKDSQYIRKNDGIFITKWSSKLWIKNTVHHQATFYNKTLFKDILFNTKYRVLADYDFNINLYKSKPIVKTIDKIIASCGTDGLSKKYTWSLYREEIALKTKASSILYWPLFLKLAILKYLFK